ncbi:hypothetical protein GOB86_12010 [Acetobacter lambici]|uniref:Uncharacterized protein n=1 Tax=Acetobacter lambici TaxID=1332824 RepID=A0ABT1F605_9PROT|nr:hypothetical protein [Acetobacter lambici]MCP1243634.1 hypothetical protein [Acetobacter lambici]MCP1259719.1 hypothetical protein [Acetobacter lambici]NHO57767.1 hypothetical protein [Acetobacter lambici]
MSEGISFPKLRLPPIQAAELTATEWASVEDKAKLGNAILGFIAKGMPAHAWTQRLYGRVSNMWGFIAHYNQQCFGTLHFETTEGRIRFLDQIVHAPCHGSPRWTWCDVEVIIQRRVRDSMLVDAYRLQDKQEIERSERAQLGALMAKYSVRPAMSDIGPQISKPPEKREQLSLI